MARLSKNDTGLGQDISRETRRNARSAAAKRAAESRRTKRIGGAAVRRRLFPLGTNGRDLRKWFAPAWAVREAGTAGTGETESDPVDEAIEFTVGLCEWTYKPDALGLPEDETFGFAGKDVVVWLDGRVRAVIRRGADGKLDVFRFDAPERQQAEQCDLCEGLLPDRRAPGDFDSNRASLPRPT